MPFSEKAAFFRRLEFPGTNDPETAGFSQSEVIQIR
jgi:hypothetical protein